MDIRKTGTFTFLIAIAALIVGFSSCDRVSEIVQPITPQMQEPSGEMPSGSFYP